ncbi:MAG: hypothetical protein ACREIN_04480, partial [Candidatus Methylomirabilaceae bacterium]
MLSIIMECFPIFAFLLELLDGGRVLLRLLQCLLALFVELGSGFRPRSGSRETPCCGDGKRDHDHELSHPITSSPLRRDPHLAAAPL